MLHLFTIAGVARVPVRLPVLPLPRLKAEFLEGKPFENRTKQKIFNLFALTGLDGSGRTVIEP